MLIKSFSEMSLRVWNKMKRPWVAVYKECCTVPDVFIYEAKVYDSGTYTDICMRSQILDVLTSDIEENTNLVRTEPGSADDPNMIMVYV